MPLGHVTTLREAVDSRDPAAVEPAPVRRQADCDYYHRVRAAGLSVHGCYAGRVYDMAVVAPGLPEGRAYDRDAALAALVRPGASCAACMVHSAAACTALASMRTALIFQVDASLHIDATFTLGQPSALETVCMQTLR